MKNKLTLCALLIFIFSSLSFAQPSIVYVDDDYNDGTSGWGTTHFATISSGISAVASGGTVNVAAGIYSENLITKSLILQSTDGPASTIISAAGGTAITIVADNVTINGFTITNPSGKVGIYAQDHNNITIENNIVDDIGSSDASTSGTNFGIGIVSSALNINAITIQGNVVRNIQGGNFKSANGIAIGWSDGDGGISNLSILNNSISNITSSTSDFSSGGRGAYGILINHGTGTTGATPNAVIFNNTINNLEGLWAHGIGLEGNTPGAIVQYNIISNLTDHKSPADPDAAAIMVEDNASANTVEINNNSFSNVLLGVRNATALSVNATKNWWGDINPSDNIYNTGGGSIDYSPWWGADYSDNIHSSAWTWYTNDVIQDAIDAASSGDVINVAAGLYEEDLQIGKNLTLLGSKANDTRNTGSATDWTTSTTSTWTSSDAQTNGEAIIRSTSITIPSGHSQSGVISIHDGFNVTVKGFVIEARNRTNSVNVHLIYVDARNTDINNVTIMNNIIGPITGDAQDGSKGRMGITFDSQSDGNNGLAGLVKGNKIFGAEGNGNNIFVIGEHYYPSMSDYSGMVIEGNDIYGANRGGMELAGGIDGLIVTNNKVMYSGLIWNGSAYAKSTLAAANPNDIKYGNGINLIRTATIAGTVLNSQNYLENITVEGNEIYNNDKMGIYTGPMQKNLSIVNNTLTNNGWDGMRLDESGLYHTAKAYHEAYGYMTGVNISDNNITGVTGIHSAVNVIGKPQNLVVNNNDFSSNSFAVIQSDGDGQNWVYTVNAENNWWGSETGPNHSSNSSGTGSAVSDNVDYSPWLGQSSDDPHDEPWTWYVNDDSDIDEVIDDAGDNDLIVLLPGVYTSFTIDKPLTLSGEDGAIINNASPAITVTADNVTITGITFNFDDIIPLYDDYAIDVQNNATNIVIRDCNFQNHLNGGKGNGVINRGTGIVDAKQNYWNDVTGPTIASNPGGNGTTATNSGGGVLYYSPWWGNIEHTNSVSIPGPELTTPANYAVGVSVLPSFVWTGSTGATGYEFQISTKSDFSSTITLNPAYVSPATSYSCSYSNDANTVLKSGTRYYWRVRQTTTEGTSDWVQREFITCNGQVTISTYYPFGSSASIAWYLQPSSANIKYDLYYSVNPDMSDFDVIENLTNTNYEIEDLKPGTDYYVLVRAKNNSGIIINYSEVVTFTTEGLAQPYLSHPVEDAVTYSNPPYLYWYTGTYDNSVEYKIKYWTGSEPVSDDVTAVPSADNGCIETNSYQLYKKLPVNLTAGATYSWKVKTLKGSDESEWSDEATFVVYSSSPTLAPVCYPSFPIGGDDCYLNPPTVYWYTGTYTTGLWFQVQWNDGSSTHTSDWINKLYYKLQNDQLPAGTYHWQVRSALSSSGGSAGDWSDTESFVIPASTNPVAVPYPTSPNGVTVATLEPTFTWYVANSSGLKYKVRISPYSNTDDNGKLVYGTAAVETDVDINTKSWVFDSNELDTETFALVGGATYYWQVIAYDGATWSNWSYVASFSTAAGSMAIIPFIVSPINEQPIGNTSVFLSWDLPTESQTHLRYDVEYSRTRDFVQSMKINNLNEPQAKIDGLETNATYYWRVNSKNKEGNISELSDVGSFKTSNTLTNVEEEIIPSEFGLFQNYPNPFNPTTRISYSLPKNSLVTIKIYDMLGREVKTLVNNEVNAGNNFVVWNGDDNFGNKVVSGTYIYRITADNFVSAKKMILIK